MNLLQNAASHPGEGKWKSLLFQLHVFRPPVSVQRMVVFSGLTVQMRAKKNQIMLIL